MSLNALILAVLGAVVAFILYKLGKPYGKWAVMVISLAVLSLSILPLLTEVGLVPISFLAEVQKLLDDFSAF